MVLFGQKVIQTFEFLFKWKPFPFSNISNTNSKYYVQSKVLINLSWKSGHWIPTPCEITIHVAIKKLLQSSTFKVIMNRVKNVWKPTLSLLVRQYILGLRGLSKGSWPFSRIHLGTGSMTNLLKGLLQRIQEKWNSLAVSWSEKTK